MLHAAVADFQHVRVVPVAGAGEFFQPILREADERHAVVFVRDVAGGAPEITGARSPGPRSFHAPVADAEDDGAAGLRDGIAEFRVLHGGFQAFRIAPVNFDVVHAPRSVGLDVLRFVLVAAGTLFAGHAAGVGVHAELQSFGVHVIGERLHAVGEALGVDDVDELVADVFHAGADHGVGHLADQFVTDVAAELVPTVPAHGRCGGHGGSCLRLRRRREGGPG